MTFRDTVFSDLITLQHFFNYSWCPHVSYINMPLVVFWVHLPHSLLISAVNYGATKSEKSERHVKNSPEILSCTSRRSDCDLMIVKISFLFFFFILRHRRQYLTYFLDQLLIILSTVM